MFGFVDVIFANTLFALLSIVLLVASCLLITLKVVAKLWPSAEWATNICAAITSQAAPLVFVVTGAAMTGSLYYSEVVGYTPCTLCWYQRIAIYSLAIISFVATIRRDPASLRPFGLALAIPGIFISIYHTWLQAYPRVTSFCSTEAPCSERHVWEFGFVSIPFMAFTVLLFTIVVLSTRQTQGGTER
jgi:disulfide bond formation protein DsbB